MPASTTHHAIHASVRERCACAFSDAIGRAEVYLRERAGVLKVPIRIGPFFLPLTKTIASGIIVYRDTSDTVRVHDVIELEVHPPRRPAVP
jgi:hypothetical protein